MRQPNRILMGLQVVIKPKLFADLQLADVCERLVPGCVVQPVMLAAPFARKDHFSCDIHALRMPISINMAQMKQIQILEYGFMLATVKTTPPGDGLADQQRFAHCAYKLRQSALFEDRSVTTKESISGWSRG